MVKHTKKAILQFEACHLKSKPLFEAWQACNFTKHAKHAIYEARHARKHVKFTEHVNTSSTPARKECEHAKRANTSSTQNTQGRKDAI